MPARLVVADAGPLNYLVLIGAVTVLPALFERIFIPVAVYDELAHADAPSLVQDFVAHKPDWLEVRRNPDRSENDHSRLDEGERAAIALATAIGADLLLMDDRAGVLAARQHGFAVTGTLGVLDLAARRGILDFTSALTKLKATNFRYPPEIVEALLAEYRTSGRK